MSAPTRPEALARGVWGVLPTPFHGDDLAVDHTSLVDVVDLYVGAEVTGLVVLGVFGESARLDDDEQTAVVATVSERAGDLPIVVGLPGLATAPVIAQARRAIAAASGGVTALMVKANSSDRATLATHLRAVHAATGLGIVLQDYPAQSGVNVAQTTLADVVEDVPAVVAVKSEAPPVSPAVALLTGRLDVPVFGGLGGVGLLDELAAGAAGAMTGFSHPEGLWAAIRAFERGGFDAARRAYAPWLPLANFEGQLGIGLAIRKEVLRRRGVIADAAVRPPGAAFPATLTPILEQHLAALPVEVGA